MNRATIGWRSLAYILFMLSVMPTPAQIEIQPIRHYEASDGLGHGTVYAIHVDTKGFLWMGTANGLVYYDGYTFRTFQPISRSRVRVITEDGEGGLWIAAGKKIYRLDEKRNVILTQEFSSLGSEEPRSVLTLIIMPDGTMRFGGDTGLFSYDPRTREIQQIHLEQKGPGGKTFVRNLLLDSSNRLWVAMFGGVVQIDDEGRKHFFPHDAGDPTSISHDRIRQVYEDRSGRLWFATNKGLCLWKEETRSFKRIMTELEKGNTLSCDWINMIEEDHQGNLWLATRTGGVNVLSPEAEVLKIYREEGVNPFDSGLPTDNAIALHFSEPASMWIGNYNAGISRLDLGVRPFKAYRPIRGERQKTDTVRAILEDSRKRLWIGQTEGLIRYDDESRRVRHYQIGPDELSDDFVISLAENSDGAIWIGTFSGGINILNPETNEIRRIRHDPRDVNSLPHDLVNHMEMDGDRIWIGTWQGVARYDKETGVIKRVLLPHHADDRIYTIYRAPTTGLWIGSLSGFYNRPPGQTTWFHHEDDTLWEGRTAYDFWEDARGRVWIGSTMGLFYLDTGETIPSRYEGLAPGQSVRAILQGTGDRFWIGTNSGLIHANREGVLQRYAHKDGLLCSEATRGASFRTPDGRIYLGGPKGYHVLNPGVMLDDFDPEVVITAIRVFGDKKPLHQHRFGDNAPLELKRSQRFFTLHFSSLDFSNPENNRFAYQLQGIDENWTMAQGHNQVSFANLPGGHYNFRLKATNSNGVWSDNRVRLPIIIPYPLWMEPWFMGLALMTIIIVVLTAHALLARRVLIRRQTLKRMADERTDNLRDMHQQLLDEARKAGFAEITTGVLHNIGNILSSISVSAETMLQELQKSKLEKLRMANDLLREHRDQLNSFLIDNPKGSMLPPYYQRVAETLAGEHRQFSGEIERMLENINLMSRAVATEQDMSVATDDTVQLKDLLEDALQLQKISLDKRRIRIIRDYEDTPPSRLDRFRLTHVLINLIRNGSDALNLVDDDRERTLTVTVKSNDSETNEIRVRDNGCGIAEENLPKLFQYGFTTKKTGNGFGLHSCLLTIEEMGGKITVGSRGVGKGAVFILQIPAAISVEPI